MFKKFTNGCVRLMNRWLPDPFLFAVILTIVVFIGSMIGTTGFLFLAGGAGLALGAGGTVAAQGIFKKKKGASAASADLGEDADNS